MSQRPLPFVAFLDWLAGVLFFVLIAGIGLYDPACTLAHANGSSQSSVSQPCSVASDLGVSLRCVAYADHLYAVADIDLKSHKIIVIGSDDQTMRTYPDVAARLKAAGFEPILITNAGIYGTNSRPLGLFITPKGKEHDIARGTGGTGNFSWDSAVFQIRDDETASIVAAKSWRNDARAVAATQSGPQLADSGKINPDLPIDSRYAYRRTAIGVDQANRHLVHIVVSRDAIGLYELASFLVNEIHCSEALHLDGDLSAFYLPSEHDKFVFSDPGRRIVTVLSVVKR
jgi:uncharacterized protein YigE (DUF2233 family)